MKERRSKLIAAGGILCFVAALGLWMAVSGDPAMAGPDRATVIAKTVMKSMDIPAAIKGKLGSQLILNEPGGVIHRLSVFLEIESTDAQSLRVYLTSPSGTRVLLVDGSISNVVSPRGLKAWFGADGMQPRQSLAAFAGEPATGRWKLDVDSPYGRLVKWSLAADLSPNTRVAGMETYGEYGESGCDCRVGPRPPEGGLVFSILLLGLALMLRRR